MNNNDYLKKLLLAGKKIAKETKNNKLLEKEIKKRVNYSK